MSRLENKFLDGRFTPFETVLSDTTNTEQPKAKKQNTRNSKLFLTCIVHLTNFTEFVTTQCFMYDTSFVALQTPSIIDIVYVHYTPLI
jgi:hypothetical protein